MFADRPALFKGLVTLLLGIALVGAGCGGSSGDSGATTTPSESASGTSGSTAEPDVADADRADVRVITGWVDALRKGDTEASASFFAVPSTAENGPQLLEIESRRDALRFNESLPCGARLIAAGTEGDFTTATFKLTERPGGDCGAGTGGIASTSFQIEHGKIVEWRRVGTPASGSSGGSLS
jgi:hypothetical protein